MIFLSFSPKNMKENFDKYNTVMRKEAILAPFKTIAWHEAAMAEKKIRASNESYAKKIKSFLVAPNKWKNNPHEKFTAHFGTSG